MIWETEAQSKNLAWVLPRPKPDHYKGGMPLHCERWLVELARDLLDEPEIDLLTLFAGASLYGLRVDLKAEVNPDIIADAHNLPITKQFDCIIADPPYSDDEAKELYGTGKLSYKKWAAECDRLLKPGGLLVIYHKYMMPNPNPERYRVVKRVFIGTRTYHLPRVVIYFRKGL